MKTGIELIREEREEQINKHKRTVERDVVENPNGELLDGAMALLLGDTDWFPIKWNEEFKDRVMKKPHPEKLAIAAALVAAEIDRLEAIKNLKP